MEEEEAEAQATLERFARENQAAREAEFRQEVTIAQEKLRVLELNNASREELIDAELQLVRARQGEELFSFRGTEEEKTAILERQLAKRNSLSEEKNKSFSDDLAKALRLYADDTKRTFNLATDVIRRTTGAAQQALSENLFSFAKGEFKNLDDAFNRLNDTALRISSDVLSNLAVGQITKQLSKGKGFDFSGLATSFAGFFDEGGRIPPGKFGVVGERGPELAFGGSSGTTIAPFSSGMRPINVTMNVSTPDAQSFKKSQNQIAVDLAAVIAQSQRNT